MVEDQLNDLRQFITGTVSQATAGLATKEALASVATDVTSLKSRVEDLDLKIDTISETLNENLNDHETRLTKLEQQAA